MTITLDAQSANPVVIKIVAADARTAAGLVVDTQNENDLSVSAVVHYGNFDAEIGGDLSGQRQDTSRLGVMPASAMQELPETHSEASENWIGQKAERHQTLPLLAVLVGQSGQPDWLADDPSHFTYCPGE